MRVALGALAAIAVLVAGTAAVACFCIGLSVVLRGGAL